ncbi:MAG TPA: gliding motility-associated C-terminal domain-containing protein, partial [Bacteroidia bacterium]|nr:gliding motility-associated C-terminal domain-containing protein [Bacteroidia bacterium]
NLQYQWDPTVYLSNANSSKTIASPAITITYTLTTLADNSNKECLGINTASVHIEVIACEPTEAPIIPNALFFGNTLEIKNLLSNTNIKIHDEIGQLIYESNNYKNNWQAMVSSGMYIISISYFDNNNQHITLKKKCLVYR